MSFQNMQLRYLCFLNEKVSCFVYTSETIQVTPETKELTTRSIVFIAILLMVSALAVPLLLLQIQKRMRGICITYNY